MTVVSYLHRTDQLLCRNNRNAASHLNGRTGLATEADVEGQMAVSR
jgi:hypothetical protein